MPTKTVSEWGSRLRRLRRQREIAQNAVARRAGVARYYLHCVEKGEHEPSEDVRGRLLEALRHFGVTNDELAEHDLKEAAA